MSCDSVALQCFQCHGPTGKTSREHTVRVNMNKCVVWCCSDQCYYALKSRQCHTCLGVTKPLHKFGKRGLYCKEPGKQGCYDYARFGF
jgi:hypothetical protein